MRNWSYFRFSTSATGVLPPRPYVFCDVHDSRLSPWMNQRSFGVNIASLKPDSVCPFCDTLTPPDIDEIWVVLGSPSTNAMLPASPAFTPVDGFDPTEGATTKNGLCDSAAAGCSASLSRGATWRTRRHRSPASVEAGGGGGAGEEFSSARAGADARIVQARLRLTSQRDSER